MVYFLVRPHIQNPFFPLFRPSFHTLESLLLPQKKTQKLSKKTHTLLRNYLEGRGWWWWRGEEGNFILLFINMGSCCRRQKRGIMIRAY